MRAKSVGKLAFTRFSREFSPPPRTLAFPTLSHQTSKPNKRQSISSEKEEKCKKRRGNFSQKTCLTKPTSACESLLNLLLELHHKIHQYLSQCCHLWLGLKSRAFSSILLPFSLTASRQPRILTKLREGQKRLSITSKNSPQSLQLPWRMAATAATRTVTSSPPPVAPPPTRLPRAATVIGQRNTREPRRVTASRSARCPNVP